MRLKEHYWEQMTEEEIDEFEYWLDSQQKGEQE
jgi:hypothetical protein